MNQINYMELVKKIFKFAKNTINKILLGATMLLTAYSAGVYLGTQKLSKQLSPLRDEYSKIVFENKRDPSPNYSNKLRELANTRKQFAEDNNAKDRTWRSSIISIDDNIQLTTPGPIAYKPSAWFKKPNNEAIQKYFEEK